MINCFILLRVSSGDMQRRRTGELALIQHRVAVSTLGQYRFDLVGEASGNAIHSRTRQTLKYL